MKEFLTKTLYKSEDGKISITGKHAVIAAVVAAGAYIVLKKKGE